MLLMLYSNELSFHVSQDVDKTAAVATVVAAVDMAREREPLPSAVEQVAKRTATAAVHIPPVQEQVDIKQSDNK